MKTLLVLALLAGVGYFAWQKYVGGPPAIIENPVYAEIRGTAEADGREIEMVMFGRASSDTDCRVRTRIGMEEALAACPQCRLQPVNCRTELPPRYARLFDDVPIPSTYLSMTAGIAGERDGRLVVFGLTDEEGAVVCEQLREMVLKNYRGQAHCIAPSGD